LSRRVKIAGRSIKKSDLEKFIGGKIWGISKHHHIPSGQTTTFLVPSRPPTGLKKGGNRKFIGGINLSFRVDGEFENRNMSAVMAFSHPPKER
jgi:hypothetical protein